MQVIEQSDIFGRIGKSVGEGFGEGAEEIGKKYSVGKDLDRIKERFKGKEPTPLEYQSELMKIPFLSESQSDKLGPLMMDQSRRDASARRITERGEKQPIVQASQEQDESESVSIQDTVEVKPSRYGSESVGISEEDTLKLQGKRPVFNQQDVENKVDEYSQDFLRYPTIEAAKIAAERDLLSEQEDFDQEMDKITRNDKMFQLAEDEFNKKFLALDQKTDGKGWSSLPQKEQKKFINEVRGRIERGESVEKATDTVSKEAFEFSKSRASLKANRVLPFLDNEGKWSKNLNETRKTYEKYDALELYRDDLITEQGLSPEVASSLAFPLSTDLKKSFKGIKPNIIENVPIHSLPQIIGTNLTGGIGKKLLNYFNRKDPKSEQVQSFSTSVANNIGENDSIKALQLELRKRGYSDTKFMDALKENPNINLNSRQELELQNLAQANYTMKDIWYWLSNKG